VDVVVISPRALARILTNRRRTLVLGLVSTVRSNVGLRSDSPPDIESSHWHWVCHCSHDVLIGLQPIASSEAFHLPRRASKYLSSTFLARETQ